MFGKNIIIFLAIAVVVFGKKGKKPPSNTDTDTVTDSNTDTVTDSNTDTVTDSPSTDDGTSYCDEVTSSNPSDAVSANEYCGDDAVGFAETCEANGYRYYITSGAPSHPAEYGQVKVNPNSRCERWQYTKMPLEWADSGSVTESMGCVGYLFSGGCVFDHRSGDADDAPLAIYWEGDSLDPYYGHSNNVYQYHYHAVPSLWSSAGDASACEHIGYMNDGGKLYGLCEVDGVELTSCYHAVDSSAEAQYESDYYFETNDSCQLDECNMYELNGEMAYFMSSTHPYVPPCMKGSVSKAKGFTPSVRPS